MPSLDRIIERYFIVSSLSLLTTLSDSITSPTSFTSPEINAFLALVIMSVTKFPLLTISFIARCIAKTGCPMTFSSKNTGSFCNICLSSPGTILVTILTKSQMNGINNNVQTTLNNRCALAISLAITPTSAPFGDNQ